MNERGRYVAPGQTIDRTGAIKGEAADTMAMSWWVSGLASPLVTFRERIRTYLEAVAIGDDGEIRAAINAVLANCTRPAAARCRNGPRSRRKAGARIISAANSPKACCASRADVQKHSIPYVIRGWGPRTSWLIDWGYLRGDTSKPEIWDQLAELISQPIEPIRLTFVDSGFRPGKTDTLPLNRVYEFCRRFPKRVRPTKGSSAPLWVPLVISKIEINRAGKAAKRFCRFLSAASAIHG